MADETPALGGWVPEFEGQRPPFERGNQVAVSTHGAYAPRKVDPLAKELVDVVLADTSVPAYAKASAYRLELWATCRAEAQVQLVSEWLMSRATEDEPMGDLGDERVRTAYLLLHRAEARAASGRTRLGLNPVAAARMGKDVAIGQAASTDVAMRMAQMHDAEQLLRDQGWTPPEGWGAGEQRELEEGGA